MTDAHVSVTHNEQSGQYEIVVDGAVAGFSSVLESDTHIAFTHTEVDDAYQRQGLASRLAAESLADAASRGKTIIPLCPYIAKYLERHEIEGAAIQWPNTDRPS